MRLTCPACKAQYEVPSSVIPEDGRDVQCSNCGETWFQEHPEADAPPGAAPAGGALESSVESASGAPEPTAEATDKEPPDDEEEAEPSETSNDALPARRKLDPNVVDVLREEAELEARARRNELAGSVESQPDLGLAGAFAPSVAAPKAENAEAAAKKEEAKQQPKSRPDAGSSTSEGGLPDAGEINSTLRANGSRPADDRGQTAQVESRERRSFRLGFTLVIALAAVCVIVYAFAPHLAEGTPELDPWLSAYVARVDEGRMWLNGHVRDFLDWLDTVAASSGGGD